MGPSTDAILLPGRRCVAIDCSRRRLGASARGQNLDHPVNIVAVAQRPRVPCCSKPSSRRARTRWSPCCGGDAFWWGRAAHVIPAFASSCRSGFLSGSVRTLDSALSVSARIPLVGVLICVIARRGRNDGTVRHKVRSRAPLLISSPVGAGVDGNFFRCFCFC